MIILELVNNDTGRTVMESSVRRRLTKELRSKYGVEPKEAIRSGAWTIRPQLYRFQPQRYVDTFGNGVYSPTTYAVDYKTQYPEFDTLDEAIEFIESLHVYGAVQRMAIFSPTNGAEYKLTAGVVYTTSNAPTSPLTEITSTPRRNRRGGQRWDTTYSALRFDQVCRAMEAAADV